MFIRDSRRYFKSSNLGLWRECRTTITLNPLLNSTNARNFTAIAYTKSERISDLKKTMATPAVINEFLRIPLNESSEKIDEVFRRHLYGHWLANNTEQFNELKTKYKRILAQNATHNPEYRARHMKEVTMNPIELDAVKSLLGKGLKQTEISGHKINAIVPHQLDYALYFGWENKVENYYLLYGFATDMEISSLMMSDNGTKYYVVKPPPPPKKGKVAHGYDYNEIPRCTNHDMFPDENEQSDHPSLDAEIVRKFNLTSLIYIC